MATIKMNTMVQMRDELTDFKTRLIKSLTENTPMPQTNSDIILQKYIKIATDEMKLQMPLRTARTLAKNVLTKIMLDEMGNGN